MTEPAAPAAPASSELWAALPGAAALVDRAGRALQGNAAFEALQTESPDWAWLSREARQALLAHWAQAADGETRLELASASGDRWYLCHSRWEGALGGHLSQWTDITALKQAGLQALEQVAQFRLLADHVPALIALYQAGTHRCLYANEAYAQAFGLTAQSILGRRFSEIIGEQAADLVRPVVEAVERSGKPGFYERQLQGPDGRKRWVEAHVIPHLDAAGVVQAAFVQLVDITRHREAEAAVRDSELRLQKFMQASAEGIVFHVDGLVSDANPALCALLGYELDELRGRSTLDFVALEEVGKVRQLMLAGAELRYESRLIHRSGEAIHVELIVRSLSSEGGQQRMAIVRDIRDRVAAQQRIQHLAHHDSLTQLLNRAAFMEHLGPQMERARQRGHQLALLFIDLDNFKRVNDSLGHLEGDKVLFTVAERIRNCLRSSDLVARFGGDEFVVLLNDVHQQDDVMVVLMALLSVVEVPVRADGRDLSVTPSIGVAMFPRDGESAEELIQHADTAMYLAKSRGRASYQFFEHQMASQAYADLVLEAELAEALTHDQFRLHYQPQVHARDGHLVGAEALLRWQHPQRGLLSPDAFIEVAERHRLMVPLGEWVMREAVRQSKLWHESGLAPVPIAVNLSSMQFRLDRFADTVREVLAEAGVPGSWLELELTERMLVDDLEDTPRTLAALRALGLSISVDDFGTGYTALAHLTELPLDKLKIDQGFVAKLPQDSGAMAITRAIVRMAKDLGLSVSAEGVRKEQQRALLAEWGCDALQGDLVGSSMSAAQFEAWLRRAPRPLPPLASD
ncbi:MAG: putative bifunctional diguanylate cyclase/phosphodiesterase [Roseateles asaccharophilus]|uniref:PAS domain S-box-containing protein/diguanylate cyclase (GGDEF)-like protein n=1 Tax=Roseateles asaccharophilus TaxID=582607 RepID=A0A4R6MVA4_9BURK|nr:EAL domain-containing protein [Roseateles asaccharophilus]MDN3544288.1 EAL domain-containing protein [Roseateles asaccharophilus]TDP06369.1 PAS domain S-box-containing protein/diguanylate cyclase (GGDEF)-like protein [Roseateles asaccharophilus]